MNKEEIECTIKTDRNTGEIVFLRGDYSFKQWGLRHEIIDLIEYLQQENKQLEKQLEYLRSGEYYNQLRFERDMLQDLVDKGEISKEDKEFIDCTHRNTELLEENQKLKEKYLNAVADYEQEKSKNAKAIEILGKHKHYSVPDEKQNSDNEELVNNAYEILKGEDNE